MIREYRRKPVIIQALQWMGNNYEEIDSFVGFNYEISGNEVTLHTGRGDMVAKVGDYIVRGKDGDFFPIQKDIFEGKYELV